MFFRRQFISHHESTAAGMICHVPPDMMQEETAPSFGRSQTGKVARLIFFKNSVNVIINQR